MRTTETIQNRLHVNDVHKTRAIFFSALHFFKLADANELKNELADAKSTDFISNLSQSKEAKERKKKDQL